MGKDKASDKADDYVQREREEPVPKVVDDKLNDLFSATKKGEREATEVLQEGACKVPERERNKDWPLPQ